MDKDSELANYLDDLLDIAESDESLSKDNKTDPTPSEVTTSDMASPEIMTDVESEYKISTFSAVQPDKQQPIITDMSPENGTRHRTERMERLLDDYNRREIHVTDAKAASQGVALKEDRSLSPPEHHPYEQPQSYPELMYMNGVLQPRWAEQEFEVVIVETAGLRIAVPVFSLGAIQSLSESNLDVNNKPKNSALFIGTAEFNHIHYPVIDSCRWFMPEQYSEIASDSLDYGYYLTHTKSHYALAVNAVHTSFMLTKDDIKWGKLHSKRPWLAGMLKNQRAILVELDMLMPHIAETLR